MGSDGGGSMGAIMAIGLLVMAAMRGAEAQAECAQALIPCAQFIGSSKPSAECCTAMKESVKKDLPCLCSLLGNKDLLEQFKVNVTQALELPKNCGITSTTSLCNSTKSGTEPPSSPPAATTTGVNEKGDASSLSAGPALMTLLLFFLTAALA